VTIPPFLCLAAVLSDRGPVFPSKPLVDISPSAMADNQEVRPLEPSGPRRSPSQAVAAQRRAALAKSPPRSGPPAAVVPVPAPVPKRTADTSETAQRQRLAANAKAGAADEELLVYRSLEEGGALIPFEDRVARTVRNLPIAAATSTGPPTTGDGGFHNIPQSHYHNNRSNYNSGQRCS
jgi:hypothetical protein